METSSKDFGAIKNAITGKTIREMTWDEIFALAGKPMTQAEALQHIKAVQEEKAKGKSSQ
ncbi:hypothetical protein [Spirosoma sp. 209]|uniref:hypothetical protein n=1 Tax=Spirosoma sp. 209 TaxID=1955701 RepID=UPI00098D56F4|nr:hypothetical protein [Spirosoma sp. 209]